VKPKSTAVASESYAPASRRPIADTFRRTADWAVRLCIRWNVHPDTISYCSVIAAGGAALCFWQAEKIPWLLLIAPALCYLRLWCNMLDGMVALSSGKASWRGEILNDLPDRVSDILIFASVAHSGLNSLVTAYWAAILAVLTAYVGLFGQAVGVQREFSGWMSKPWRMVMLHLGAWITWGWMRSGRPDTWGTLTPMDLTCLVVITGCVHTIWIRLRRIMQALRVRASNSSNT